MLLELEQVSRGCALFSKLFFELADFVVVIVEVNLERLLALIKAILKLAHLRAEHLLEEVRRHAVCQSIGIVLHLVKLLSEVAVQHVDSLLLEGELGGLELAHLLGMQLLLVDCQLLVGKLVTSHEYVLLKLRDLLPQLHLLIVGLIHEPLEVSDLPLELLQLLRVNLDVLNSLRQLCKLRRELSKLVLALLRIYSVLRLLLVEELGHVLFEGAQISIKIHL